MLLRKLTQLEDTEIVVYLDLMLNFFERFYLPSDVVYNIAIVRDWKFNPWLR